jgi:hypothetical protein
MRVNGALEVLAARQASGILEIDGDPAGTIYSPAPLPPAPLPQRFRPVPSPGPAQPAPGLPAPGLPAPPALAAGVSGAPAGLEFTPAAPDLLRRVLEGLRRNS